MTTSQEKLREELADLQHQQWSGWMEYLFSKCTNGIYAGGEDGSINIPPWAVERWKRQMITPYSQLNDGEKESDRIEADKYLPLIAQAEARGKREGVCLLQGELLAVMKSGMERVPQTITEVTEKVLSQLDTPMKEEHGN